MARLLTFLGLRAEPVVRFLNYPSFALVILLYLPFFPIAWAIRLVFGQKYVRVLYPLYGWLWLAGFGLYRRVWYHPKVNPEETYVYMAEHFSLHDIPLYGSTWPNDTRALSAYEYANVPMYGWILRTVGTQFIERRNTKQAIADLAALSEKMQKESFSVLVVPTGTRAENAQLPPFKRGVFHFAVELKQPIVPMYLIGLENLRVGKNFCRPGRIDVVYGEPIRPDAHPEAFASVDDLLELVRERMLTEGRELRRNRAALIPAPWYAPS
jgi:1-acyl-sn-glycerol-3-phosphate acyltransferase